MQVLVLAVQCNVSHYFVLSTYVFCTRIASAAHLGCQHIDLCLEMASIIEPLMCPMNFCLYKGLYLSFGLMPSNTPCSAAKADACTAHVCDSPSTMLSVLSDIGGCLTLSSLCTKFAWLLSYS